MAVLRILGAAICGVLLGSYFSFADTPLPCPECPVEDSMVFETYYPSPYGYYEELRGDKIIVGDTDNSRIDETHLPPSGTLTFEPKSYAEITNTGTSYEGAIYYDSFDREFKYYDKNNSWQPLVGGGGMSSSQINTSTVNINAVKGYSKITVDGKNYALPYYTYGNFLVNSKHNDTDCTLGGGIVVNDGGNNFCKFSSKNAVPSGWSQYLNWSSTQASTVKLSGGNGGQNCASCSQYTPNPGTHSWANIAQECGVFKSHYCAYDSSSGCEWEPYGPSDTSICSTIYEIGGY